MKISICGCVIRDGTCRCIGNGFKKVRGSDTPNLSGGLIAQLWVAGKCIPGGQQQ